MAICCSSPADAKSNEDDIVLQTREVLEKIDALLAAAGSDKQHILSAQIWLKNIEA